jgi:hypothetical protein
MRMKQLSKGKVDIWSGLRSIFGRGVGNTNLQKEVEPVYEYP